MIQAVIGATLIGCESTPTRFVTGLSQEERAVAAQLPVYRETLPKGSYRAIGPVEGLSCQITHDDRYRVSEDNAIEELRRASFQAGANAVMAVSCEPVDRQQSTRRCFRSIVCRGTAVETTREASN